MYGAILMKSLLILGAGGHGKSVAEAALLSGMWSNIVFIDDRWPSIELFWGLPVVSDVAGIEQFSSSEFCAVAAVGNNQMRQYFCAAIESAGLELVSVIHPRAYISPSAVLAAGSTVMAFAMIGTDTKIGRSAIINSNTVLDHDCELGDFVHLGVGVKASGAVKIGSYAWLQAGCIAGCGAVIAENAVVTVGTVLG